MKTWMKLANLIVDLVEDKKYPARRVILNYIVLLAKDESLPSFKELEDYFNCKLQDIDEKVRHQMTDEEIERLARELEDKKYIQECANEGIPKITGKLNYLIYGNAFDECHHSKNLTFAIERVRRFKEYKGISHLLTFSVRVTRDNGYGDSLKKVECSSPHLYRSEEKILAGLKKACPEHPTFKRMVEYFKKRHFPIRYWDGEKIIEVDS